MGTSYHERVPMNRFVLLLFVLSGLASAQDWSLERLFSRPYVWGSPPSNMAWSKKGHTLVFLWNADGRRFKDLYAYDPDTRKRARLTDLEKQPDDLNVTEEEKDERQNKYLMPPAGVGAYSVSEDGKRVAFAYKGDLYLVNTDGQSAPFRLTRTKAGEGAPQWSPDGTKLSFVRGGQLHVQDLSNGQLWQVTDIEGAGNALGGSQWSPDGKWFVYGVRRGSGRTQVLPNYSGRLVSARPFPRSVAGDEPEEISYFLVSSEGGKARPIDTSSLGKGSTYTPRWSPDSTRLLLSHTTANSKKMTLAVLDAKSATMKTVYQATDERWIENEFSTWSPDSKWILFLHDGDGFSHLYKVAAEGGAAQQLTRGKWEIHNDTFSLPPQWVGESIYFSSAEPGPSQRHWYRIKADGSGKELLAGQPGLNVGMASEDGKSRAVMFADLKNPFDLYVDGQRVTTSPRPEFSQYKWPESRFYTFPSKGDGATVHAKMLLPPGYNPNDKNGRKWPAVFFIHGAGYATSVLQQWGSYQDVRFAYNCYLANKGYVVFDIDYRGSSGYGRDWRTGIYLHMGGKDLDDVLGGVEYARQLGNIDMKRLGIWGVSYGGFMTNMALFQAPGVFQAGSSWAAVNDWENYNAGYTRERLNTPASDPEAYRRSSPIWFSNNLKDHLLIVHGMGDDNVLFQDAVQLTEKLIQERKPFDQIFYPEESHGFVRDETWIDAFRRTTEWFDRYLR